MRKRSLRAGLILLLVTGWGCSHISSKMERLGGDAVSPRPAEGQAVVVFMRPSSVGYAVESSVFDLKPDHDQFIGIVSAGAKVAYPTAPGQHQFMVIGENADFLNATLVSGRTYYVLVTPRLGWWKARFSLKPVRKSELGTEEFAGWNRDTELVENTDESRQWATDNWDSIEDKKTDYMRKWDAKPQDERDEQTLRPDDGQS